MCLCTTENLCKNKYHPEKVFQKELNFKSCLVINIYSKLIQKSNKISCQMKYNMGKPLLTLFKICSWIFIPEKNYATKMTHI